MRARGQDCERPLASVDTSVDAADVGVCATSSDIEVQRSRALVGPPGSNSRLRRYSFSWNFWISFCSSSAFFFRLSSSDSSAGVIKVIARSNINLRLGGSLK